MSIRKKKRGKESMITDTLLQEEKQELMHLIDSIEKKQSIQPDGSLRISKDRKHYSFYHYKDTWKERYPAGKYISKKEMPLIQALAQKDYEKKLLRWAKDCYVKLDRLTGVYRNHMCADIYNNLSKIRKELIIPYEISDEEFADQWLKMPYTGK